MTCGNTELVSCASRGIFRFRSIRSLSGPGEGVRKRRSRMVRRWGGGGEGGGGGGCGGGAGVPACALWRAFGSADPLMICGGPAGVFGSSVWKGGAGGGGEAVFGLDIPPPLLISGAFEG